MFKTSYSFVAMDKTNKKVIFIFKTKNTKSTNENMLKTFCLLKQQLSKE